MASVLIIGGGSDTQDTLRADLRRDGHDVELVAVGDDPVAALRRDPPDLVLCGLSWPDEEEAGDLVRRVKHVDDPAIARIPVVSVTADSSEDAEICSGIEGAVACLVTPVASDVLRETVRAALDGDPEPEQRHRTRVAAMESLARRLSGRVPDPDTRVRLTRLERTVRADPDPPAPPDPTVVATGTLTERQTELLRVLRNAPSVSAAAATLGMSRTNVYASLRRVNRTLGIGSVQDLLHRLRTDQLRP